MKESEIPVTLHIGQEGITDAIVREVRAQIDKRKVIKAKRLRTSFGEASEKEFWTGLAAKAGARLLEVRGHTALLADQSYRTTRELAKWERQRASMRSTRPRPPPRR